MLDLLSSVPAGVWIGLAVFAWIFVTMIVAAYEFNDDFDEPVSLVGILLLIWPFVVSWNFATWLARTTKHRRVCPKCKSKY